VLNHAKTLGNVCVVIRERNGDYLPQNQAEVDLTGKKVSMLLELPDSAENLYAGFKSKLRSQIKKAEKNGLTFHSGRDTNHVDQFYRVFSQNMRHLGSPTHSYKWFDQLRINYKDDLILGIVKYNSEVVGAGILIKMNGKSFIPWASTLTKYNPLAPNMLLYWNLLKYACDTGSELFDFGRSTFGEGTYKFKKQWGALPTPLNWTVHQPAGRVTSDSNSTGYIRNMAENVWRHLPLAITNTVGPLTRKYISL
jgi:FemAB-related protein (PEP-CTERM system-associated)